MKNTSQFQENIAQRVVNLETIYIITSATPEQQHRRHAGLLDNVLSSSTTQSLFIKDSPCDKLLAKATVFVFVKFRATLTSQRRICPRFEFEK